MRDKIQRFLQLNHSRCFSTDYLSRYLDIPLEVLEVICDELIEDGFATRPEHTHYVAGVEVDWAAVHAGTAVRPEWSKP